jgi:hypothetical protein
MKNIDTPKRVEISTHHTTSSLLQNTIHLECAMSPVPKRLDGNILGLKDVRTDSNVLKTYFDLSVRNT